MDKSSKKGIEDARFQRVIVSLPRPLVGELRRFAGIFRGGNKSGFVADAIRGHMEQLRKVRHTQKLREGYAAATQQSRAVALDWAHVDEEAWAQLDALETKAGKAER